MTRRRILFVDDDPEVLQGLQRMLAASGQGWDMEFTTDPAQALEILGRQHFDVVVCDIALREMPDHRFLSEVMRRHPHLVRILLAGEADRQLTLEGLVLCHQMLAKPCNADTLRATIHRALALRRFLDGDTPLKALISRLDTLPSLPVLYARIVRALQSPDTTVAEVAGIIGSDPPMAAKILQLVNSAYFGLRRPVSNLHQGIGLLGLDTIKTLVLTAQVFASFEAAGIRAYRVESLWQHSAAVGWLARRIVEEECGGEEMLHDATMGGLLHDVGKLILASNLPNIYEKVMGLARMKALGITGAERQLFGAAHAEVGAYLFGLWGLPEAVIEAVAYHHEPGQCGIPGFSAVTAVHAANALVHEVFHDPRLSTGSELDRGYLEGVGVARRVEAWRSLYAELGAGR